MKKTEYFSIIFFMFLLFAGIAHADYQILIDHTSTNLSQIPSTAISQAKSNLHIAYQHTSHGSQLITGMEALASYPDFGNTYEFSDNGASGLDLDDYGIPGGVEDLSQGDYIDGNGVTPWVTSTRNLLDNPSNTHVNVIMWSWCSINDHDAQRYVDNMEILISEYGQGGSKVSATRPAVQFVFMTGHAEGQGEDMTTGSVHYNNELIRDHCRNNNRILFDFADIEAYNPGNPDLQNPGYQYFWDLDMQDNLDYTGGNWAAEWLSLYPDSELAKLTTGDGVAGYEGCSDCAHSSSPSSANLNCILKGRASWWLWARLAGWQGNASCLYTISPSNGRFPASGGTISVSVSPSSSSCTWTASETLDWVSLSPASGTGSGLVTITATSNTGAARSGSFTIAGQPFTINQQAGVSTEIIAVLTDTSPNHTINAGSDVRVYGTASSNQIILASGSKAELLNFPGQNVIQIQSSSDLFTVSRSGSVVAFHGSDGTSLKIPATTDPQTISFDGEEIRVLQIYNSQVMLDDQIITKMPAPVENLAKSNLTGSWLYDAEGLEYAAVVTFIDETNYMFAVDGEPDDGGGRGMERGVYNWDPSSDEILVSALSQTAGDWGLSDFNTDTLTVVASNNTLNFDTEGGLVQFSKISSAENPLIGSWLYGMEGLENSAVITFIDDTNYIFAVDGEPDDGGGRGMERGTYIWNALSGAFSADVVSNTAGDWGISSLAAGTQSVFISGDVLNFNHRRDGLIQFKKCPPLF